MTQPPDREPVSPSDPAENDENAELFSEVLSALDRNQLPLLGQDIVRRTQPQLALADTKPVVGEPIYGSYHVLFPLTFHTDLCWLAKIPVNGTAGKWDDISASSLAAEAKTMQFLKRETTIPLPDVLDFSSTIQNALRCPYMLMSYISGVPLYDVWFGHKLNGDDLEVNRARRTRALKIDQKTMLDRWFVHQDPADDPIYASHAASTNQKAYYTFMIDLQFEEKSFQKGLVALLRQLISWIWIPEPSGTDRFVLAHPDFDIQNFIVSEDGDLRGIVDWDGVAAISRTIGTGVEPDGVWEDSPSILTGYRQVYKDAIAKCQRDDNSVDLCRMSLITDNLFIAVEDPRCRSKILCKVTREIWNRAGRGSELDFAELVATFAENNVDVSVMNALQMGLNALLIEEGV
ncbi:hypothetical protein F4679DRAFT_600305 [Xylaria curta]|nr:hypothetical protein F4679DRAFT_600305 [Xylaria curta]